ncbi:hypothetical protein ABW20_dc0100872 [Dactylellina cionopaga]|nr:hypothetical protein ABW20_dc0100872 [Dactylellina cionopaga]
MRRQGTDPVSHVKMVFVRPEMWRNPMSESRHACVASSRGHTPASFLLPLSTAGAATTLLLDSLRGGTGAERKPLGFADIQRYN